MRFSGRVWGATDAEVAASYACEEHSSPPYDRLFRAVTIDADVDTTFRWVCQLKIAPYSYDLLDNRGRRSPRELTPGAEMLEEGQPFDVVFTIAGFIEGREITGVGTPSAERVFGPIAATYRLTPVDELSCRLVVCVVVARTGGWTRARRELLIYGDLIMMRKQLLTLKKLAQSPA